MCPIIVQHNAMVILALQENIFDVHHHVHLPRECLTGDNMSVANVSHSASMTHIDAYIILLLILICLLSFSCCLGYSVSSLMVVGLLFSVPYRSEMSHHVDESSSPLFQSFFVVHHF